MDIKIKQASITGEAVDLIVVNLFQGVTEPGGEKGAVDKAMGGAISAIIAGGISSGSPARRRRSTPLRDPGPTCAGGGLRRSGEAGRGTQFVQEPPRRHAARDLGAKTFATIVHGAGIGGLDAATAAGTLVEGTLLGLDRFEGYRSKPPKYWKPSPETMIVVEIAADRLPAIEAGVARGEAVAAGVTLARIRSTPGQSDDADDLGGAGRGAGSRVTGPNFEAWYRAECKALGMGIFMAVAEESEQEPKLIILGQNPARRFAGAGACGQRRHLRSGGISIKPGEEMWRMKGDMVGVAAVSVRSASPCGSACRCA